MRRIVHWWREWNAQAAASQISARVSAVYFCAHACIGVLCAFAPPGIASSSAVRWYADLLNPLIPSIGALASISSFPEQTKFTLTVLWTCVPIAALIVGRVHWFWIPDTTRLRRHPSLLLASALLFGFIIVTMMRLEADISDLAGSSYGERFVTALSTSRLLLGGIGGVMCGSVALCFGLLYRIPRVAKQVLQDDYR